MVLASFLAQLWPATKEMFRSFVFPSLGWSAPAWLLTPLLVFGVLLAAAGSLAGSVAKGKHWAPVAWAGGAAVAAWVFFGGRDEVATFFVILALLLSYLGGIGFVLGCLKSPWVAVAVPVCIVLAATGLVPAGILGTALAVAASVLGILSLYRKFEGLSPGRRGSRWNRRSAAGWVACLLVAGFIEPRGLAVYGPHFKIAGMVVGVGLLLFFPRTRAKALPGAGKRKPSKSK